MKFNPVLFSEWFSGWEAVDDPVAVLKRAWVLSNIVEDERREYEEKDAKFDVLLQFIDGETFKKWKAVINAPSVDGGRESVVDEDIETLPMRRLRKPEIVDTYIAKRMQELAGKLKASGVDISTAEDEPVKKGEKTFFYKSVVVPRGLNGR